ncbi:MAG: LamG domain-containing protein [Armatimonadia bacterium]
MAGWGSLMPSCPEQTILNAPHPLASGLVGLWIANSSGRGLLPDYSGMGGFGGLAGDPTWGEGYVSFDGVDDYASVPDSPRLQLPVAQTYCIMARVRSYPTVTTQWYPFISRGRSGPSAYSISLGHFHYHRFGFALYNGAVNPAIEDPSDYVTGTWYMLHGTYDGTALRLYRNGVQVATTAATMNLGAQTSPLLIAKRPWQNYWAPIDVRLAAVWGRALTAAEIAQQAQEPFCMVRAPSTRRVFRLAAGGTALAAFGAAIAQASAAGLSAAIRRPRGAAVATAAMSGTGARQARTHGAAHASATAAGVARRDLQAFGAAIAAALVEGRITARQLFAQLHASRAVVRTLTAGAVAVHRMTSDRATAHYLQGD